MSPVKSTSEKKKNPLVAIVGYENYGDWDVCQDIMTRLKRHLSLI